MRLLPRLVLLVACVPLLLPPGLCACGSEVVAPSQTVKAVQVESPTTPAKRCGCGHTAKHKAAPTQAIVPAAPEHEHRVPHTAHCPAVSGTERAQLVERAEPVEHVTALAFVCAAAAFATDAEPMSRPFVWRDSAHSFEDRPRYLTHCALLF